MSDFERHLANQKDIERATELAGKRAAEAARLAGERAAEAARAAGQEAAFASEQAAWAVTDAIAEQREFQIFWDTLTLAEKRAWKEQRDEELRIQAEIDAKLREEHERNVAERMAWEAEQARLAQEEAERLAWIRALNGDPHPSVSKFSTVLVTLFSALSMFVCFVLTANWFIAILTGALVSVGTTHLMIKRFDAPQYFRNLNAIRSSWLANHGELPADVKVEAPEGGWGKRFTLFSRGKSALKSLVLSIALVGLMAPVGLALNSEITSVQDRISAIELLGELDGLVGKQLTAKLGQNASRISETVFVNADSDWAFGMAEHSDFGFNLLQDGVGFETWSSDLTTLEPSRCLSTSGLPYGSRKYIATAKVRESSDFSGSKTVSKQFLLVFSADSSVILVDPCSFGYEGAAFYNSENTEYSLSSAWGKQNPSDFIDVVCPEYLFGKVGQRLYCSYTRNGSETGRVELITQSLGDEGTYSYQFIPD